MSWARGRLSALVSPADLLLGVGLAVLVLTASLFRVGPSGPSGPLDWGACVWAAALAYAVAVRRKAPLAAVLITDVVTVAWFESDYHGRLVTVGPLIACYTLAAQRGWRQGVLGGVLTAVVTVLAVRLALDGQWFGDQAVNAIPLEAAAVALGAAVHSHRAFAAGARERAERIAEARAEQARAQAAEERLEIARELHDVFGHTMAAISVQAGVAVHVMRRRPEQAAEALHTIKQISDEGLAEVQILLGAMRSENLRTLTATGGLAHLDKLLDITRASGVEVALVVTGDDRTVPVAVDLAAFRIIQESLTNVRRHAKATRIDLSLQYRPAELEILVRDDGTTTGTGPAAPAGGHGITGMRARAAALGGSLTAGPRDDGGFQVRCVLPTREGS